MVSRILVVYVVVIWTAALIRVDHFPLTWAPMYSVYTLSLTTSVCVLDKELITKGLFVTHRDGSTSYVSKEDLNIPKGHFRRLSCQRMFGKGPPKHSQGNRNLSSFNRWLRGLDADEPNFSAEWDWRIFRSLNKTLGHEPSDPKFIVRVEANPERRHYLRGDLSKSEQTVERASLEWKVEWLERWNDGTL
jgi:hypothetical protein